VDNIEGGDVVEVDLASGSIKNQNSGLTFIAKPYPDFMAELIATGGLIEHTRKKLGT
jgi:3-isopropylmalate/(R)-2-methylmalate dehydratase small subunit